MRQIKQKDIIFSISLQDVQKQARVKIGWQLDEGEIYPLRDMIQEGMWLPAEISVNAALEEISKNKS